MKTVLALLCPPLAVLLTGRPLTAVLTLALTLCFWVPGAVHAMMIVSQDFKMSTEQSGKSAPKESLLFAFMALALLCLIFSTAYLAWPAVKECFFPGAEISTNLPVHSYR